jgi:radical SAM superfamily enzyme YgiQ (UPF0313 family)
MWPMPHVTFVPFCGFRVREPALLELGMTLPGFRQRAAAIGELPALGLLTLAGMLPEDWTCSYIPAQNASLELADRVIADGPALVAISALTASIEEAYFFAGLLRARNIRTVIGGLHASLCPSEARQHCDAVAIGDGEPVWPSILNDARRASLRPEYRAIEATVTGEWVMPRFDLLVPSPPRWTLQTQRGCPLGCEFCGASRLLGSFREKPAECIRNELAAIRKIDLRPLVELADDNTFAGDRDCVELLDVLEQSGARWFTETDWRIGERPELLARLAQAGCVQVLVGIESLVFRYPGMGQKQAELERIMAAVEAIQAAGVAVNGCFIVGAEGETQQSLDRLIDFVGSSPLAEVQVTLQTPFPGTLLYRKLKEQRRLLIDRGWPHYTLFDVTYLPDAMSVEELEQGFRRVLEQTFSGSAARRRERVRHQVWHRNARLRPVA